MLYQKCKKPGYINIFKKIISIITLENTKEINLNTYSIYFEQTLIERINIFLPLGCFYHYW